MTAISKLTDSSAVQKALSEFETLGRTRFLQKYGFGRSHQYMIRDRETGDLYDSKAIVGVAYGIQFPDEGYLTPDDFSGGEATVQKILESLGFEVVKAGIDWTEAEVISTVDDYFEMLHAESHGIPYSKAEHNSVLRQRLRNRSKASVELKHQNISAVLDHLGLPFIRGYKPRANVQGLLREIVERHVLSQQASLTAIVDAFEESTSAPEKRYSGVVVTPPFPKANELLSDSPKKVRTPRKIDFASRDEANRNLGRNGEEWAVGYEKHRLIAEGRSDLALKVDWVSDRLGDGSGYDIASFSSIDVQRHIEVKTTNGGVLTPFVLTRNELSASEEMSSTYHLYRIFDFRHSPHLYVLKGDLRKSLALEPLDYRARLRALTGS